VVLRILKERLKPYSRPITIVILLQLAGTIASLYLPSLNADIIDNGVITGDTAYITRTGAWMLLVSLIQVGCTISARDRSRGTPL
jgi:ATP-binding cassette subfamily B protein